MEQFPFWPAFWLVWVVIQLLWRRQETWECIEEARIKQFWQENRALQIGRALIENAVVFASALAISHLLALLCRVVQ